MSVEMVQVQCPSYNTYSVSLLEACLHLEISKRHNKKPVTETIREEKYITD